MKVPTALIDHSMLARSQFAVAASYIIFHFKVGLVICAENGTYFTYI